MPWMTHNPAFEPPERLVERFAVRHHELHTVLRALHENTGNVNQHLLVIAPRGRGKTMLVRRVAVEIARDPTLAQRWCPIIFGEESYNISTAGEFWLEALLHLADATGEARWREVHRSLHQERDERRLAEAARARLLDHADAEGQRLLLIVENLDTLFEDQLGDDDAWALRRVLLDEPRIMLLGTAVHRFPGVEQPDRPLFDLFKRVEIPALDDADCETLWHAVTGCAIGLERGAAVRVLTGGSPRWVVLLAEFSEGRDLRSLLDDLAGLIDQHTDYFKHNIESLATQQRRVFLALARLWAPSTAREVAEAARLDVGLTSAQLKRLEADGRVEITETRGKSHLYQVSERLHNIYHLMRSRGGAEGRVRALIDFIHHFYQANKAPSVVGRVAAEAYALPVHPRRGDGTPPWLVSEPDLSPAISASDAGQLERASALIAPRCHTPDPSPEALATLTDDLMRLAAAGAPAQALAMLQGSAAGVRLEPLVVALAGLAGERIDAPVEVREVAEHVRARIEGLARTGDPWRVDPRTVPIVPPP